MTKDTAKLCFALIGQYETLYFSKYGKRPVINRHREKWAMQDVIDSIGYDRSKELLDYYFTVENAGHPLSWFFYNFDRLDDMQLKIKDDERRRAKIRAATKEMMEAQ